MADFLMPSLGADMDEGTVVEWLVKQGDVVHRGDIVVNVETQKGIIEVEIWDDGVIEEFLVAEGEIVPVGTPLARLGPVAGATVVEPATGEKPPAPVEVEVPVATRADAPGAAITPPVRHLAHELDVDVDRLAGTGPRGAITREDVRAAAAPASAPVGERVAVSPLARRRARELGVDLGVLHGSGPDGVIVESDVAAASAGPVELDSTPVLEPVEESPVPPHRETSDRNAEAAAKNAAMRQAIAKLMTRAKREIPHYYLGHQIDMGRALAWLEEENSRRPVAERVLPAVLLLKAAARAIRAVPEVNGFWMDDEFRPSEPVHLGVAISLRDGGLIAPAIHNADTLALPDLMSALRDLVKRTRSGRLRSSEMSDPTITVTNLGDQGVDAVYGVIYAPQVALVGFGKIVERPWAHDGMVGARPVVTVTLSADHRAGDGHTGGLYLAEIERLLQKPEEL
ncbi:MAG: 2-oxo acid dehydrogenase subunit E2 [Acidimicrobiia bacterium]|nr:2-oxo acid dehydrogenase subunit E2 [Acidimicrobiia bacterium]